MCFFFYIFDGWSVVKLTGLCGWSWVALRASVGGLGLLSGALWAVLGHFLDLRGRSWVAVRASVGGPGLLSGPQWTVLGCSQSLCGRSWVAVRASVGGLGEGSGRKWPKPEQEGDLARGSGSKSGPNPSGKALQGRGWNFNVFVIVFGARSPVSIFFYR